MRWHLLDEVNQLLDFRKLDKQKAQLSLSYGNLSDFVKETCDSFKELSLKNGIQLELNLMDADISMSFDRNKMQRNFAQPSVQCRQVQSGRWKRGGYGR